jgi:hypothetical protein
MRANNARNRMATTAAKTIEFLSAGIWISACRNGIVPQATVRKHK